MGYYDEEKISDRRQGEDGSVSANMPFGQAEMRVGYDRSKLRQIDAPATADSADTVEQIKATYQYNLSKRTAMYTTVSLPEQQGRHDRVTLPGGSPA